MNILHNLAHMRSRLMQLGCFLPLVVLFASGFILGMSLPAAGQLADILGLEPSTHPQPSIQYQRLFLRQSSQIFVNHLPHFSHTQQRNSLRFFRSLLWWTQIILWLLAMVATLMLFPQTRQTANWLLTAPIELLSIFFVMGLARRVVDMVIQNLLKGWAERQSRLSENVQRTARRLPTITQALEEITASLSLTIALLWFLSWINTPILPILTSLGLIGLAGQNLIKDWLKGCLILWEDQYAIGDIIAIHGLVGVVEYMNLRMTQLRTSDGELVTIDHGSFSQVKNLSNQWSRVNLGVDVAYNTDLDKAIALLENVALQMQADPLWGPSIVEPPLVLGVDQFGDNSITIRLWIKTKPQRQWDVAREFRRRLKPALDKAGISIPFPQRSIWFENSMFPDCSNPRPMQSLDQIQ